MKPSPTARERRLLALAKYWKQKAIEHQWNELALTQSNQRKDKVILEMQRHAEGIVKAWNKGVISFEEIK